MCETIESIRPQEVGSPSGISEDAEQEFSEWITYFQNVVMRYLRKNMEKPESFDPYYLIKEYATLFRDVLEGNKKKLLPLSGKARRDASLEIVYNYFVASGIYVFSKKIKFAKK